MARSEAPHLHGLAELADLRVGTVSGYRYPQLDAALGSHFLRDDGPTAEHSLRKLLAGRSQYAIVEQLMADFQLRGDPEHRLRIELVVNRFQPQCAFSQRSKLDHAQMKRALDTLIDDGSIDKILAHYR
jgi:polar amino acid transport system substrate-binding protein